jgi:hypothetical protein
VARCPFLGLAEMGSNPFPFPSVSHHCYVSMPGRPADQGQQETYCLTDRHAICPLFPSAPEEEVLVEAAPEPVPESLEREAVVKTRATEAIETEEAQEPQPDRSVEIFPPGKIPEPAVKQAVVAEVAAPAAKEILAEPEPVAPGATEESVAIEEPARAVPSEPPPGLASVRSRGLLRAVAGVAALAFLCLGAMVVGIVVGLASGIDISTLRLPTPGSSLLLVSGVSFAGAVLLLGLLLWARRQGPP